MLKVSVIIPVYEVEKYLGSCLNSVLGQTFQNWEAICVNDGSPDNCNRILAEYAQKDKRIKVINQTNQGVSSARNNALKKATGDYICFLDADDELAPIFLEKMCRTLIGTRADMVWCDFQQGTEKGGWNISNTKPQIYSDVFDRFLNEQPNMGACVWNKMYKKDLLTGLTFPLETGMGEDLVFLYKALWNCQTAVHIAEPLYFYRIRKDSATNKKLSENSVLGNIKTAELLVDYFKDQKVPAKTQKILNQKIAKRIFKFGVLEPKRKDKEHLDQWYDLTQPILADLKQKGIYQTQYLSLKNRLRSLHFLKRAR